MNVRRPVLFPIAFSWQLLHQPAECQLVVTVTETAQREVMPRQIPPVNAELTQVVTNCRH